MAEELSEEKIQDIKEAFLLFDKDEDGKITTDELEAVMKSLGRNPSEAELQEIVNEIDVDGNGTIEFPEFLAMVTRKMKEPYREDEIKEAFALFDKDGDGFISNDELRQVMVALGEEMDEEQIADFFNDYDTDKDGRISYEEFTVMMMTKETL